MRVLMSSIALAGAVCAAGCASGPQVHVDRDPAVDLRAYKTFGFPPPTASDRGGYATLAGQRVQQATREQMERLGYAYTERNPDLRVHFALKVAERQEVRSTPGAMPYRAWGSGVETVRYREGTLHIDLVDTRRNALVWQGVGEGTLGEKARQQPAQAVEETVRRIFERFMPVEGA